MHRGRLLRTDWSTRACFAGLGPGEVTVGGRTEVGVSQRRARGVARFQTAVVLRWDADALAELLGGVGPEPPPPVAALEDAAAGLEDLLGHPIGVDEVEGAFLQQLPGR